MIPGITSSLPFYYFMGKKLNDTNNNNEILPPIPKKIVE